MGQNSDIYDLGEVDRAAKRKQAPTGSEATPRKWQTRPETPVTVPARRAGGAGDAAQGSLALFLPGVGQILSGNLARGLFFLVSLAFMGSMAWAVLTTLDRLTGTLNLLGYPPAAAVWALGLFYALAALLHLGGILSGESSRVNSGPPHPVVAGVASLLVPGWGQILNGDRGRAVLFLGLLWLVGAAWILVSPPARTVMTSLHLYLPATIRLFCTPAFRWTIPAVVWALAVYDAATRASHR